MTTSTFLNAFIAALSTVVLLLAGAQEVLPRPERPFGGKIGRITQDSEKVFQKPVEALKA